MTKITNGKKVGEETEGKSSRVHRVSIRVAMDSVAPFGGVQGGHGHP